MRYVMKGKYKKTLAIRQKAKYLFSIIEDEIKSTRKLFYYEVKPKKEVKLKPKRITSARIFQQFNEEDEQPNNKEDEQPNTALGVIEENEYEEEVRLNIAEEDVKKAGVKEVPYGKRSISTLNRLLQNSSIIIYTCSF